MELNVAPRIEKLIDVRQTDEIAGGIRKDNG
jgi:hypothetical protein